MRKSSMGHTGNSIADCLAFSVHVFTRVPWWIYRFVPLVIHYHSSECSFADIFFGSNSLKADTEKYSHVRGMRHILKNYLCESRCSVKSLMLCFSSLRSLFSFCQNSESSFTIELISPRNSGNELLVELVATNPTQKTRLNLACLVLWATRTVGMAQKGQPHALLVMSSSVTRAFSNLCPSNLWHFREPAAVAPLLSHFLFCRKKPWFGVIWCVMCKHYL